MEFNELAEMNHAIFRKMRDFYKTGRFGSPIALAVHIGRGMEKYSYQSCPIASQDAERIKAVFVAGIRAAIAYHGIDWAVVSMDAFKIEVDPKYQDLYMKVDTDLLVKSGLARRVSVMSQFAQTKDGKVHALSAKQDGERSFGPVQEQHDWTEIRGTMMLFQPPSQLIRKVMDASPEMFSYIGQNIPMESMNA